MPLAPFPVEAVGNADRRSLPYALTELARHAVSAAITRRRPPLGASPIIEGDFDEISRSRRRYDEAVRRTANVVLETLRAMPVPARRQEFIGAFLNDPSTAAAHQIMRDAERDVPDDLYAALDGSWDVAEKRLEEESAIDGQ